MKKLILLFAALFLIIQLSVGQMSRQPEFSTWVKTESVRHLVTIPDNSVYDSYENFGQITLTRKQKAVPWKVTGIAIFATVTEAIGDGMYDNGDKIEGKLLQAVSLGSHFLYIEPMRNSEASWWLVPVVEMCWRFILFDIVHNLTRGLPIGYIGNTSYFDRGMQAFAPPTGMRLFADGVVIPFVLTITFDKF